MSKLVLVLNCGSSSLKFAVIDATTGDDLLSGLADAAQFLGYQGDAGQPSAVLLCHNGLHLDLRIEPVRLSQEIGQMAEFLAPDLKAHGFSLALDLSDVVVLVDHRRLGMGQMAERRSIEQVGEPSAIDRNGRWPCFLECHAFLFGAAPLLRSKFYPLHLLDHQPP